jgi:hypothetical protein
MRKYAPAAAVLTAFGFWVPAFAHQGKLVLRRQKDAPTLH